MLSAPGVRPACGLLKAAAILGVCWIMFEKIEYFMYYASGRHLLNQGIMLKMMLGWRYNVEIMPE